MPAGSQDGVAKGHFVAMGARNGPGSGLGDIYLPGEGIEEGRDLIGPDVRLGCRTMRTLAEARGVVANDEQRAAPLDGRGQAAHVRLPAGRGDVHVVGGDEVEALLGRRPRREVGLDPVDPGRDVPAV